MTKEEFRLLWSAYQRTLTRTTLAFGAALLVGCVLQVTLPVAKTYPAATGIWIVLAIGSYLLVSYRNLKTRAPRCPHCHWTLNGHSGQVVIATGNCGHCGNSALTS